MKVFLLSLFGYIFDKIAPKFIVYILIKMKLKNIESPTPETKKSMLNLVNEIYKRNQINFTQHKKLKTLIGNKVVKDEEICSVEIKEVYFDKL